MEALEQLETAYHEAHDDIAFHSEFDTLLRDFVGRPTPLHLATRLTRSSGGARIYLKREDLNHTGAHKINNALGQVLLARRLGKSRIIAETGAGQHGVATATAAALLGLECVVYMGAEDVRRQRPQRPAHAIARGTGPSGDLGRANAEGRHQRGDPRLGDSCRHDPLRHRLGGRTAPLSAPGARLPECDRPRGTRADPRLRGEAARRGDRVCRRRLERDRDLPPLSGRCRGTADRRRGSPAARASAVAAPARFTARTATCCRTPTGRWPRPTRSPRGSTIRESARNTPTFTTADASSTGRPTTARRSPRCGGCVSRRASCPPSRAPTRWPAPSTWRARSAATARWSSTSPGAATRTWAFSRRT